MIKHEEALVMRAIALCFKPFLKQEEAMIYCNLGRTQFAKRSAEFGIFKNYNGYYKREDLDLMCSETPVQRPELLQLRQRHHRQKKVP